MGQGFHFGASDVFLRVALISLWKGLEGEWRSLFSKGSSADPPPVQQYKGEGQGISAEELALVATSGFPGRNSRVCG